MTARASYDAHAGWYDAYLTGGAERHTRRTAEALCATVGPGRGVCLDVGCGTGVHAQGLRALGWAVLGVDLSFEQLRQARERLTVAQGDATRLPLQDRTVDVAVATLFHTDVDDWGETVREVARVLRPGGRFVYVGVHPCFIGPFAERADDHVRIHPGYLSNDSLTFDGPGLRDGIRARVGVRHRSLAALLNAIPRAGLVLAHLEEPADGPTPDLLVLEAIRRDGGARASGSGQP